MSTQYIEHALSGSERNKEYVKLIIIIALFLAIIGSFVLYLSWPLLTGKTIVLATQPVDPFDPLRGQYITIRYNISSVLVPTEAQVGETIYVSLAKGTDGVWSYIGASLQLPREGTFIKGKIKQVYGREAQVEYGIEQYFFERNAQFETRGIQVEAKVSPDGQARITRLLQDGEPLKITYQNKSLLS